jgi:hypothetical protein
VTPSELKALVLSQMEEYVAAYEPPPSREGFGGNPWSKERVRFEVERMRPYLVEPREASYLCEDDVRVTDSRRLVPVRKGWIVADDGTYQMLFDIAVHDFVLVHDTEDRGLVSWGIRGNAPECFISR